MKIVVCTPTFLPVVGGAEIGIHEIYRRIGLEHEVVIMTRQLTDDELSLYGGEGSWTGPYRVVRVETNWTRKFPAVLRKLVAVLGLDFLRALVTESAKRGRPDVVNIQFLRPLGLLSWWLRLFRIPTVISLVGRSDVLHALSLPRRGHAYLSLLGATSAIQNSRYYTAGTSFSSTTTTIPYGVSLENSAELSHEHVTVLDAVSDHSRIVLSVQRLSDVKRVDLIVDMFSILKARVPDAHLVLVGKGPCEEAIRKRVSDLGVRDVLLLGHVDSADLARIYSRASLYVSHSMNETFGVTFAEAMAAGLPIVAADTSCISMVLPKACSKIFQPGDVTEFAAMVESYLEDVSLLSKAAASARAFAIENFDWDIIADTCERSLRDAVG